MENKMNTDQMRDAMAKIMEGLGGVVKFAEQAAKTSLENISDGEKSKFQEALKKANIKRTREQMLDNISNLSSELEKLNSILKKK